MVPASPLIHLDTPGEAPLSAPFLVKGWVASMTQIEAIFAGIPNECALTLEDRPDVRSAHPAYPHVTGFIGLAEARCLRDNFITVFCRLHGGQVVRWEKALVVPVPAADKAQRLERIRPLLRHDLPHTETPFHFNFLTPEMRKKFPIGPVEAISSYEYGPSAAELIERLKEGLILDAGAGFRRRTLPNVVNLEIVPYPSTDVLAVNEELPFLDNSFEAVISCAVLEHLKDPFAAARELIRVVKPGGCIYADVPFLQPYHGYPSHFYNMTSQGLANLFEGACEIQRTAVPIYGKPIWTLVWFLNSYLAGLPPTVQEQFRNLRVADLLARPEHYLPQDFVRQLSSAKDFELASVTSVWAVKK